MIDADMIELRGLGVIQEANRRFFHPLGLHIVSDEAHALKITPSPAGVVFMPDCIDTGRVRRFDEFAAERLKSRKEALGYYIQPAENPAGAERAAVCCECIHSTNYIASNGPVYTCQKVRESFVSNAPDQFKACVLRNKFGTCQDFEVAVESLAIGKRLNQANTVSGKYHQPEVAKDC